MPSLLPSASLLVGAGAVVLPKHQPSMTMRGRTMAAIPMQMFRADCTLAVKNNAKNPGAGMNPESIEPFQQVLKDGYYGVECLNDYMYLHGDKFGNNKFSYEIGEVSNVSIVHYDFLVAPEDRESMTPNVCFSFCRTIPDMTFFGIHNGKDCYCTPYYKPMAGDDSMCDVVCEGDGSQICGSKTKSSMFGMHQCSSTQTDLNDISSKLDTVKGDVVTLTGDLSTAAAGMQSAAAEYQTLFGSSGDPVAADLMQTAKVHAGELEALAAESTRLTDKMTTAHGDATGMSGNDFTLADKLTEAEEVINRMEGLTADAVATHEDLTSKMESSAPSAAAASIAEQYYHVMYFVDKENINMSSTCGGTSSHTPLVGNLSTCAAACDADIHECVGFSYFPKAGSLTAEQGLCFLMSKFKTLTYYTKCGSAQSAQVDPSEVQCYGKFSKFEGTTLAVDGTGKCKECFKEVTKADRCFV